MIIAIPEYYRPINFNLFKSPDNLRLNLSQYTMAMNV